MAGGEATERMQAVDAAEPLFKVPDAAALIG
jgi:hypothetical protein